MSLFPDPPPSSSPELQVLPAVGSNRRTVPRTPFWAEWMGVLGESKTLHLITFSRNVAMMLEAGQPLDKILNTQAQRARSPMFRQAIAQLRDDLAAGHSFTEALHNNEAYFGSGYVGLLSAGDVTGQLPQALQKAAESLEWGMQIRKKLRIMALSPIFIILVLFIDIMVFIGIVLPIMLDAGKDAIGASAPAWLHIVSWVAHGGWVLLIAAALAVAVGIVYFFVKTPVGKRLFQEMAISLPVACNVVYDMQAAYFLMDVLMAYSAGLTLSVAADLGIKSITNEVVREQFDGVGQALAAQGSLTAALEETGAIPADVLDMLATGEETGSLEKMLTLSLQYLERELDDKVELLMNIAKPVTMVVMVLLFGVVLLGIFAVIFNVLSVQLGSALKGVLP